MRAHGLPGLEMPGVGLSASRAVPPSSLLISDSQPPAEFLKANITSYFLTMTDPVAHIAIVSGNLES